MICVHPGCADEGDTAFMSDPDDKRCRNHHNVELARRIEALNAAKSVFLALVGGKPPDMRRFR